MEEIPDDYLKSSILKFLCLEFKIADLIPHVLKKSQILIEKDVIFFKEEVSTSNNVIEFLEAPTVKANINDLKINLPNSLEEKSKETALDELSNPSTIKNEEVSEKSQKKKQEESEKSSNFFKNFFRKSNSKSDQTKIEDGLSENIKEKRKIVDKLHLETILYTLKKLSTYSEIAINQDFLKNFEKENYNFKSKVHFSFKII